MTVQWQVRSNTAEAAEGAGTANEVVPAGLDDPISHALRLLLRLDAALDRVAAIRRQLDGARVTYGEIWAEDARGKGF